jgi:hypothetical protein
VELLQLKTASQVAGLQAYRTVMQYVRYSLLTSLQHVHNLLVLNLAFINVHAAQLGDLIFEANAPRRRLTEVSPFSVANANISDCALACWAAEQTSMMTSTCFI